LRQAGGYEHVYLSPHLDDAVLSCGGAIAAASAQGERTLVVTICSAVPSPRIERAAMGASPVPEYLCMSRRLAEDSQALDLLGVDYYRAGELDAVFRRPEAYAPPRFPVGEVAPSDPLEDGVRHLLQSLFVTFPNATVHAPLGIGNHVDHVCVSDAARALGGQQELLFYEDFPYLAADLGAIELRMQRVACQLTRVRHIIGPFLPTKIAAIARYVSQVGMLFGSQSSMRRMVEGWAQHRGGGVASEFEWSCYPRKASS
jgi:LmbE family N-acetylglucosaminyl deacetylase